MAQQVDTSLLCKRWVHSREEDTPTEVVYRPAGFPLPPSRGRSGLEFDADGSFKRIGIGATDVSNVKEGSWQIDDMNAGHVRVKMEGQPHVLKINDLKQDRMTVKRE